MTTSDTVWRDAALVLLVGTVMLGYRFGQRSIENIDHVQFVLSAQSMFESGDWWRLESGGQFYARKPHFLFWAIVLCAKPFGYVTALAARLPCALSLLGCGVATYLFGRSLFNRRAGLITALFLITTWTFAWNGRRVRFDVMATLAVIMALWALWEGWKATKGKKRAWPMFFLAGMTMTWGTMVKGPLVLVLALVPFILFLLLQRAFFQQTKNVLLTLLVFTVLSGIYAFIYTQVVGLQPILAELRHEALGHALGEWEHAREPFYYYLTDIPSNFVPWFLLVIPAVPLFWRARHTAQIQFLAAWCISLLVLLSLSGSKSSRYAFPLYPALALIAGYFVCVLLDEPDRLVAWTRRTGYGVLTVLRWTGVLLALIAPLMCLFIEPARPYLVDACVAGALMLWVNFSKYPAGLGAWNSTTRNLAGAVAVMVFAHWFYIASLCERDEQASPVMMLHQSHFNAFDQELVVAYGFRDYLLDYYAGYPVPEMDDVSMLSNFLQEDSRRCALIRTTDWPSLPDTMRDGLIEQEHITRKDDHSFGLYSQKSINEKTGTQP